MHTAGRHYRNQVVRLPDLTVTQDVIVEVTFENCTLVGPAVILMMGEGEMTNTHFDGPPEAWLWPLGDKEWVTGAIIMMNCRLIGCRLQRIGMAYPPQQEDSIRAGFAIGS